MPVSIRYPYFDRFDPSIGITRQIALLSLLDPDLVVSTAHATTRMMSYTYEALPHLGAGEEKQPALLFSHTMPDFALFQEDMLAHVPAWQQVEQEIYTADEREEMSNHDIAEFFSLHSALQVSSEAALQAIFQAVATSGDDGTARGLHRVLHTRPELRVAVAGHTHTLRRDQISAGQQTYVNTASWTIRYRPPTPDELNPATLAWLRSPATAPCPLRELTATAFALISAEDGQSATVQLCIWEGGRQGQYRILGDTE
jgi:hypothetical protein